MTSRDVAEIDQNGSYELVLNSTADSLARLEARVTRGKRS